MSSPRDETDHRTAIAAELKASAAEAKMLLQKCRAYVEERPATDSAAASLSDALRRSDERTSLARLEGAMVLPAYEMEK